MGRILISDEIVKLLICIATMKRGHTDEQMKFLKEMENCFFKEGDVE